MDGDWCGGPVRTSKIQVGFQASHVFLYIISDLRLHLSQQELILEIGGMEGNNWRRWSVAPVSEKTLAYILESEDYETNCHDGICIVALGSHPW